VRCCASSGIAWEDDAEIREVATAAFHPNGTRVTTSTSKAAGSPCGPRSPRGRRRASGRRRSRPRQRAIPADRPARPTRVGNPARRGAPAEIVAKITDERTAPGAQRQAVQVFGDLVVSS